MRLFALSLLVSSTLVTGCSRLEGSLNRFQRSWDASPKTVTLFSLSGEAVKTYDIGRSKVSRATGDGDYIYFYANGRYVQTNMPYVVEGR